MGRIPSFIHQSSLESRWFGDECSVWNGTVRGLSNFGLSFAASCCSATETPQTWHAWFKDELMRVLFGLDWRMRRARPLKLGGHERAIC